jgi:putative transposase
MKRALIKLNLTPYSAYSAYSIRPYSPYFAYFEGVQYASAQYRALLARYTMVQSMSRRANCWDNAVMESTFKSLKVECVYRTRYETRDQARAQVFEWIEAYYNRVRLHSSLNYLSPERFELHLNTPLT